MAAISASAGLDAERSTLYVDLILNAIPEAARQALLNMNPANYEYQSEFAKRYVAEGKAEGKTESKAEVVIKLLTLKFGAPSDAVLTRVRSASIIELDAMVERVLTAQSAQDVVG